jgi:hypothetical protein
MDRSCIYVLATSMLPLVLPFSLNFRTVQTMWYPLFFALYQYITITYFVTLKNKLSCLFF